MAKNVAKQNDLYVGMKFDDMVEEKLSKELGGKLRVARSIDQMSNDENVVNVFVDQGFVKSFHVGTAIHTTFPEGEAYVKNQSDLRTVQEDNARAVAERKKFKTDQEKALFLAKGLSKKDQTEAEKAADDHRTSELGGVAVDPLKANNLMDGDNAHTGVQRVGQVDMLGDGSKPSDKGPKLKVADTKELDLKKAQTEKVAPPEPTQIGIVPNSVGVVVDTVDVGQSQAIAQQRAAHPEREANHTYPGGIVPGAGADGKLPDGTVANGTKAVDTSTGKPQVDINKPVPNSNTSTDGRSTIDSKDPELNNSMAKGKATTPPVDADKPTLVK